MATTTTSGQKWQGRGARTLAAMGLTVLLASCGGGGGSAGFCFGSYAVCNPSPTADYSGVLSANIPSENVAGFCDANGQRQFTRSYFNEAYLWSDEVPEVNSSAYTPEQYFYQLRVTTPDSLGLPKDRFSYVVQNTTADTISTGVGASYGVYWAKDASGLTRVAQIIPDSPASAAGMARGGILVSVISSSNSSWYPNNIGEVVSFSYKANAAATATTITLTSAKVTEDPVPTQKVLTTGAGRRLGYVLFNAFTRGAQDKLITTMTSMAASGIQDLVLDLRYNGGGFLYVAHALGSMVTGPANDGKVFERLQYNKSRTIDSDRSTYNISGTTLVGETAFGKGAAMPRLNLPRVYILSSGDSCSASESVINGLRGVDVEVILVGGTTCGKPYGFTRRDNCGLSLFPIEFQGLNHKGFGDFMAGFTATCPAPDDFDRALGDATEGLLSRAISHAETGVCTPAIALSLDNRKAQTAFPAAGLQLDLAPQRPGKIVN